LNNGEPTLVFQPNINNFMIILNNSARTKPLAERFNPDSWTGYWAFQNYTYAGINLISEVNALDPDLVIDVGCGHNRFKGHIKNLIGFDEQPFPFADIHQRIEDVNFRPESADVLLILGSIQFISQETIFNNYCKVLSWLKPGGYAIVRCNWNTSDPFNDQSNEPNREYLNTNELLDKVQTANNLKTVKGPWVESASNHLIEPQARNWRRVWWWQKPGTLQKYQIEPRTCEISNRK
jgi:hypothetical protein